MPCIHFSVSYFSTLYHLFNYVIGLDQTNLPISQIFSKRSSVPDSTDLKRERRGFRSYFYNYLDEIAMSICASIPSEGPGLLYAVRRTCGEKSTCRDICTDPKLRKQGKLLFTLYRLLNPLVD